MVLVAPEVPRDHMTFLRLHSYSQNLQGNCLSPSSERVVEPQRPKEKE